MPSFVARLRKSTFEAFMTPSLQILTIAAPQMRVIDSVQESSNRTRHVAMSWDPVMRKIEGVKQRSPLSTMPRGQQDSMIRLTSHS